MGSLYSVGLNSQQSWISGHVLINFIVFCAAAYNDNKALLLCDLTPKEHVWDVVEWEISIMDVQKKGVVGGQGKVSKERSQTRSYPAFASSW